MRKWVGALSVSMAVIIFGANETEASSSHTVQSGDTLWSIANNHDVSVEEIKNTNNKSESMIHVGESLQIPSTDNEQDHSPSANEYSGTASEEDKRLLSQLVTAEATGEPYEGQVAVAEVVLNRVESSKFPNTIQGVIHEQGQFTPVQNGSINQVPTDTAERAVEEALNNSGQGHGSLFFYNPQTATNLWNATREETKTIGNHVFSK
ncbi:cell wall hydrolase [Thalassorhabdus alkalitolerans]|uniref:Cell wall hydrolase n=1 Tax=Thalassorhabdus alkalitolerans TaxID=2282697 RepID=A0ABW0YNB6_9BACI|nr:cell wall hydrolase [Thalassobacillus sp. C254]